MNLPSLVWSAAVAASVALGSNTFAALPLSPEDGLTVLWKGQSHSVEDVAAEAEANCSGGVSAQLERYRAWLVENDYHVSLTDDLRVILVTSSKKSAKKRLPLVEATLETFDALLAPPNRCDSDESFRGGEWGVAEHAPDAEPVVLIELDDDEHYQALLAALGEIHPDMQTWASVQSSEPGFDEERIMTTGWQSAPDGYEIGPVWRSKNELVNRLSRLLMYRSYGPQPHWLNQATGWAVEYEVVGDIYCFPHRNEFIGVGEHDGWRNEIRNRFKSKKSEPLQLSDFADWKRGTFEHDHAAAAWGFIQFLAHEKPEVLPALAEANRVAYKAGFTVDLGDGNWRTNPSFAVTPEAQFAVLKKEAGDDVLEDATDFFRSWKKSRTTKASSRRR